MDRVEFKHKINAIRKANKDKWYYWSGLVEGFSVQLKGFNTWLQIIEIEGVRHDCPMDCSVMCFIGVLDKAILYHLNKKEVA